MKKISKQWQEFWFAETQPHALAFVRIAFGLFLIFYWCIHLPRVAMLFSDQGLVVPLFYELDSGWIAYFLQPQGLLFTYTVFVLALLSIIQFTLGHNLRMQGMSLFLYGLYYFQLSYHHFPASCNRLFLFTLLVLSFSGADRTWSLKMRLEHGSWTAWQSVPIWPQRLLALQISATYLGVGWQKLVLPQWQEGGGAILLNSMMGPWGTPLARWMLSLDLPAKFYDWSLYAIVFWEFFLPFGLWVRRWQWIFFVTGAIFHILIALLIGIWWFVVLIPMYCVYLPRGE